MEASISEETGGGGYCTRAAKLDRDDGSGDLTAQSTNEDYDGDLPQQESIPVELEHSPVNVSTAAAQKSESAAEQQVVDQTNVIVVAGTSSSQIIRLCDVEFAFLDANTLSCGLCGEITPYRNFFAQHLKYVHQEVLQHARANADVIRLQRTLDAERRAILTGFSNAETHDRLRQMGVTFPRPTTTVRIRADMTLEELQSALRKKLRERVNRALPVTVIDRTHVRCGICSTVVSVNKRFEITHILRHFKAWHPASHECSGHWLQLYRDWEQTGGGSNKRRKFNAAKGADTRPPLSASDFAVLDGWMPRYANNLQCIWCGAFLDSATLAQHFEQAHNSQVRVPRCNLCLREVLLNAQLKAQFGGQIDFEILCVDETNLLSDKYNTMYKSEKQMVRDFRRRLSDDTCDVSSSDEDNDESAPPPDVYRNSAAELGKSLKPKRAVIMPAFRQAAPVDSAFVQPVSESHWKCRRCEQDIYAAVISAGVIKHYKKCHPEDADAVQYELVRARLERVSDGCMEFMSPTLVECLLCQLTFTVHVLQKFELTNQRRAWGNSCMEFMSPTLVECLLCQLTFTLHVKFNISRAVRHLRTRHADKMPENAAAAEEDAAAQRRTAAEAEAAEPQAQVITNRLMGRSAAARKRSRLAKQQQQQQQSELQQQQHQQMPRQQNVPTELVLEEQPDVLDDQQQQQQMGEAEPQFDLAEPQFAVVDEAAADGGGGDGQPQPLGDFQVHHVVGSLQQLRDEYGIDLSKVRLLTDDQGQQYVLVEDDEQEEEAQPDFE